MGGAYRRPIKGERRRLRDKPSGLKESERGWSLVVERGERGGNYTSCCLDEHVEGVRGGGEEGGKGKT